jgi:hypothetical protein
MKKTQFGKLKEKKVGLKPIKESKEKAKHLEEYQQERPYQLDLFEFIQPVNREYSNTVELYDFMPKYVWGKVERIGGEFLRNLRREFECRDKKYSIDIAPARLRLKDDSLRECFPGKREELVEDGLRRLATTGKGLFLDNEAGVVFTLYELQSELKASGHSYSYDEIKDAIRVLNGTKIVLKNSGSKNTEIGFSPIENYGFRGEDGETTTYVRFSPLVTKAIRTGAFQLVNYDVVMSYKSVIARQLHKRMSHNYTQASISNPYHILLSTIIRDFGLSEGAPLRDFLHKTCVALDEMKNKDVLLDYKVEKTYDAGGRRKLLDAKFVLIPSLSFVSETKHRNARRAEFKQIAGNVEETDAGSLSDKG